MEGSSCGLIYGNILWHLPEGTEDNYKQPHLGWAVPHQDLNHTHPKDVKNITA